MLPVQCSAVMPLHCTVAHPRVLPQAGKAVRAHGAKTLGSMHPIRTICTSSPHACKRHTVAYTVRYMPVKVTNADRHDAFCFLLKHLQDLSLARL